MNRHIGVPYIDYPVLFVDDETDALTTYSLLFEDDFTIYTAPSAKEGLKLLEAHPEIALVITDQRMPEMNGIEFLQKAIERKPELVGILITAYTEMEVVIDAINRGNVYRYVAKPYDESDLRIVIRQGIEKYFLVGERDRLYAEKLETMKKIARTNRLAAIGTLAAGMAHEINNPLVAISTFMQMIPQKRNEKDEEYWEGFYGVAIREVGRIKTLIAELLSYSRPDKAETGFVQGDDFEEVDLNRIVNDVTLLLFNEAKRKGIALELKLKEELPLGKMSKEKVRQVIINLALNAIQATEKGKITITTTCHETPQPYLQIVVADTGLGISEENVEKLFNPFFTTKDKGTGLGLMTCHSLVDQHRGSIDVTSKLGKGTEVTVKIPIDPMKLERRNMLRKEAGLLLKSD